MNEQSPMTVKPGILNDVSQTKIIELIGAPGVGKTALHNSLCKQWSSKNKWVYPEILLSGFAETSLLKFWSNYQLRKFMNRQPRTVPVDYGLKYIESHKMLAEFLWNHICDSSIYSFDEIAKRYRSAYFLFKDFSFYQAIWDKHYRYPCIIDEGLLEKSFLILDQEQAIVDLLEEYLPLIPLPYAVIYLQMDNTEQIVQRLLNRGKVIASHKGKTRDELMRDIEKWQIYFGVIVQQLKKLNVPVYTVDGLLPIEQKVRMVNSLFDLPGFDV